MVFEFQLNDLNEKNCFTEIFFCTNEKYGKIEEKLALKWNMILIYGLRESERVLDV